MSNCFKTLVGRVFIVIVALLAVSVNAVKAADGDAQTETGDAQTATGDKGSSTEPLEQSSPAGAATADSDVLEPKVEAAKGAVKNAAPEMSGQTKASGEARLAVLLTGAKTMLRFELENLSSQTWMAYAPFSNGTVLSVMNPQGQIRLFGQWKPEQEPFAMEPGSKKHWDVDIAEYCRFPEKGLYTIWIETGKTPSSGGTVALNSWYEGGKTESNRIQFVKE